MPSGTRVIAVGHAALDRIYRIAAFPPEPTKVRALEHVEAGGGMAANAAVTIARLGGNVELWSRVGDDAAGFTIRQGLKSENVDVRWVQSFADARSSTSAIIVDGRGERLIVGMRDTALPSGTHWLPLERIAQADVVLADLRWLEALRQAFGRARQEAKWTVLDADLGAREALPEILALTDFAIFSAPTLREAFAGADDAERLEAVLALGPLHAGVTLGADGYLWREQEGPGGHQPGFAVDVTDTTGAGDAFHGAFAHFLAQRCPVPDIVQRACAAAALECTRLGSRAGLPTRAELEQFLSRAMENAPNR